METTGSTSNVLPTAERKDDVVNNANQTVKATIDKASQAAQKVVDKATDAVRPAADWVKDKAQRPQQLMEDTTAYIGKNPWKSVGIAFAAGFLFAKLMR